MGTRRIIADEMPNNYPSPKPQELSSLAKHIYNFENKLIVEAIEKLPRLLMTSSDSPAILHEGFHYNSLHIAARAGNAEAAQFILSTVSSKTFMKKMYPNNPAHTRNNRTRYLVDLYLNTVDRGASETPLHFACKFNFFEVAKVLLTHPLCDITIKNKDVKTAEEVIGSRVMPRKDKAKKADSIRNLFYDTKIVPIWIDIYCESAPIVGKPVDFRHLGEYTPKPFKISYSDAVEELFGPVDMSCVPVSELGTKRFIRAYAGPMDQDTATKLQTAVKGTGVISLDTAFQFNGIGSSQLCIIPPLEPSNTFKQVGFSNCQFTPKRRLVRKSVHEIHHGPVRTLNSYISLSSTESENEMPCESQVQLPSKHMSLMLSPRAFAPPSILSDKFARLTDPEKGLEKVGRKYAHEFGIPWNEYWRFLDEFCDLSTEAGMIMLEDHLIRMKEIQMEASRREEEDRLGLTSAPSTMICKAMDKLTLGSDSERRMADLFVESHDLFLDRETIDVFVNGTKPSKEDFQAYHALPNDLINQVDVSKFPLLIGWYNSLKCSGDRRLQS